MTIPDAGKLLELADRVVSGVGCDNDLDVLIEVALFEPNDTAASVRANSGGTKVIYTSHDGKDSTHWAEEWTRYRPAVARALRARAQASPEPAIKGEG